MKVNRFPLPSSLPPLLDCRYSYLLLQLHRSARLGLLFDADRWVVAYEGEGGEERGERGEKGGGRGRSEETQAMLAAMWDVAIADGIRTGGGEETVSRSAAACLPETSMQGMMRKNILVSSQAMGSL
eukprot:753651-Hanusia_phi.AAC.6